MTYCLSYHLHYASKHLKRVTNPYLESPNKKIHILKLEKYYHTITTTTTAKSQKQPLR